MNRNTNNIVANNQSNFINDIKDSNDYIGINYILTDNRLSLTEKQLKIENYIFNNWVESLLTKVKDNNQLLNSNIGLDLLKYSLQQVDSTLTEYKDSKKYSKGKIYFNFVKLVSNTDIISIMLRNVIPKLFNNEELNEQNIISLFEKVGKEVVNNVILNIYNLYKLQVSNKSNINLNFSYKLIDDLILELELNQNMSFTEFKDFIINKIILHYSNDIIKNNTLKDDLHYLIGGDLIEFFSSNTDLYQKTLKRGVYPDFKTHRVLLPGSNLSDLFCKHMMYSNQKLPMIVKPND